jgi:hypothetical protein
MSSKPTLYERDFHAWTAEQANLLREGRADEADLANIAEEIDSMGRTEKRELSNRIAVLLLHLIKWRFQPALRGRSWRATVAGQRVDIEDLLEDNPSLRSSLHQYIGHAWRRALIEAERETGLDKSSFPQDCPWDPARILDDAFWPE